MPALMPRPEMNNLYFTNKNNFFSFFEINMFEKGKKWENNFFF